MYKMIVFHIVQCNAVSHTSVNDAASDAADSDSAVPDAVPDHVCTALRKTLNVCVHDHSVHHKLRSDCPRRIGISREK